MYGSEEIVGPVSIGAKEVRLVARGGHAGDVVDHVLVPYRVGQGARVVQIAGDLPNPELCEEFGLFAPVLAAPFTLLPWKRLLEGERTSAVTSSPFPTRASTR